MARRTIRRAPRQKPRYKPIPVKPYSGKKYNRRKYYKKQKPWWSTALDTVQTIGALAQKVASAGQTAAGLATILA